MQIRSFLKVRQLTINVLKDLQWQEGYILATADIASLCMIISHRLSYDTVQYFLDQETLPEIQRSFILLL